MAFSASSLSAGDAVAAAIQLTQTTFKARIAFGLRNKPRSGETSWLIVDVQSGAATAAGTSTLASANAPEEALDVVLGIAATEDVWSSVQDESGFLRAVQEQKFFITGEAPFFICHLGPILDIWKAVRTS